MDRGEIEALLQRHQDAFVARDPVALAAQHTTDALFESPAAGRLQGRQAIEQVYRYWLDAFPDMRFTWDPPLIDGAQAALFWQFAGTIQGPFFGVTVPGARVEMNGAAHYRFRDGGIAEARHIFDFSAVLMKAGVLKARPV
jgi:predicted ester cyclase